METSRFNTLFEAFRGNYWDDSVGFKGNFLVWRPLCIL